MFKIEKIKLIFIFIISTIIMLLFNLNNTSYATWIWDSSTNKILICDGSDWRKCSIEEWTRVIKENIKDIEKTQKASVFIQNIVAYLLMFLWLIGVLYVIYAWFNILLSAWEESKLKTEKQRIVFVIIGLIVIFLAYSITFTILKVLNDSKTPITPVNNIWTIQVYNKIKNIFIDKTYALTPKHFGEYVKEMRILEAELTKEFDLRWELTLESLNKLENIVIWAWKTFPDNDYIVENTKLYTRILTKIEKVKNSPSNESYIQELSQSMIDFKDSIKVDKVKSSIIVRPSKEWNAPFIVSFVADSSDPSWIWLKNNQNFEWWIKTKNWTKKIVWRNSTLVYTFDTEWTYSMHLKVTSSSRNKYWNMDVIPYEWKVEIKVKPHIAFINLSIEWKKVGNNDLVKLPPEIWSRWIVIDASNSQPIEWTKFIETEWDFWNWETKKYKWWPKIEVQRYTKEKAYNILLKILTNEWKTIEREINLDIRQPIAEIKSNKKKWFINEKFTFSAISIYWWDNIEYSWKIKKIENADNKLVFTSSWDNINYKFKRTWKYIVELKTTTYSWKQDADSMLITIDSQEPVANFELKEKQPETPNVFEFDATWSYDPDYFDTNNLKYIWYINWEEVELDNKERWNAIWEYTFKERWKYIIKLEVIDSDWKTWEKEKTIEINSLLSIDIKIFPKMLKRWKALIAEAITKYGTTFIWDFWDWSWEEITSIKKIIYKYNESWEYTIKLKTTSNLWEENSTQDKVYVIDSEQPIAIINVLNWNKSLVEEKVCDGRHDWFIIDRTKAFTISAEDSINIDWKNDWLTYLWEYKGLKSRDKSLNYKSTETECFPVTLTVMSTKNKKEDTKTIYLDVRNIEPKVDWLSINIEDINKDPVIVNVKALNPRDKDWAIVSYLWYYKTDTDPNPQDFQITQTPYTTFVLPKINEKFYFTLVIEDTNWAKFSTDKLSEKYSITLTWDNINTPIVSLDVPDTSVNAWEEVVFNVNAKNILLQDISRESKYKWDFDWDWFYDKESTVPSITNIYTTPWKYRVKVKVTHKWISNVKYQEIIVSNELIPRLESISVWNRNVALNTSRWAIKTTKWIINRKLVKKCKTDYCIFNWNNSYNKVTAIMSDWVNKATKTIIIKKDKDNINIAKNSKNNITLFSYPKITNKEIIVDSPLINKIFIYINPIDNAYEYIIDNDIDNDSDLNWVKDDDIDNKDTLSFKKWEIYVLNNINKKKNKQTLRIIVKNENWDIIDKKEINIIRTYIKDDSNSSVKNVTSNDLLLTKEDKLHLSKLENLINSLNKEDKLKLKPFLSKLKEAWYDDREKTQVILAFERVVLSSNIPKDKKDKLISEVESILISQSELKWEIWLAVSVIKWLIPKENENYDIIVWNREWKMSLVDEILSHPSNIELNKQLWSKILNMIKDDSNIPKSDKFTIKDQVLIITSWWKINTPKEKLTPVTHGTNNIFSNSLSTIKTIGKWVLILLSVILWIFILLLIIGFVYYKTSKRSSETRFQDFIIDFLSWKNKIKEDNISALNKKEEERVKAEDLFNANFNSSQESFVNSSDDKQNINTKDHKENKDVKDSNIVDTENNTLDNKKSKDINNVDNDKEKDVDIDNTSNTENINSDNEWDIPDWLKTDVVIEDEKDIKDNNIVDTKNNTLDNKEPEDTSNVDNDKEKDIDIDNTSNTENINSDNEWDIPDWLKTDVSTKDTEKLKNTETEDIVDTKNNTLDNPESVINKEEINDKKSKDTSNVDKNVDTNISNDDTEWDIPDWLKASVNIDKEKKKKKSKNKKERKEKKEEVLESENIKKSKAITKIRKVSKELRKVQKDKDNNKKEIKKEEKNKKNVAKTEKTDKIKAEKSTQDLPDWLKTEANKIKKEDNTNKKENISENEEDILPSWLKTRDEQLNNKS